MAFTFNRKGARELSRFTGDNVGRFTAIILDGKIKSFPVIKSKIPDGRGVIEGTFTDVEARDLAIILRAGALPAPMFTREERTVGPSLGSDSIRQGLRAGLFGAGAVVVFMMIYYQLSGVIATLGLVLTMVSLFGFLAYFGAALTLPGIAGLVLTVGMAVDANVLIYERIREELRREKTIRSAVDAGYERAFVTILDSNLTTLIIGRRALAVRNGTDQGLRDDAEHRDSHEHVRGVRILPSDIRSLGVAAHEEAQHLTKGAEERTWNSFIKRISISSASATKPSSYRA